MRKPSGPLHELGLKIGTGKASGHSYMPVYQHVLAPLQYKTFTLVELGVDQGDSILMWLEWFPRSKIIGVDTDCCAFGLNFKHERFQFFACDHSSNGIGTLFETNSIDVIIDDGCHVPHVQRHSCEKLWPALKDDGYYFVEDINLPPHTEDQLKHWSTFPFYQIWGNFMNGYGDYRDDDVFVLVRKQRGEKYEI